MSDNPTAVLTDDLTPHLLAEQPLPTDSWAELNDRLIVRVSGSGTEKFLQGQFSQNVTEVTAARSLHAAANNRKGRAYALVRMVRHNDDILMDFNRDLADASETELRKYLMLFRDTTMTRLGDGRIIGIFGSSLARALTDGQDGDFERLQQPGDTLITQYGPLILLEPAADSPPRYELWLQQDTVPTVLTNASQCSLATWQAGQVAAGVPWLSPATAGAYVPQMLNWQHLGGVHFKKGCYTGQEVIARMHFLGQLKKSLYRLTVNAQTTPAIGGSISNGKRSVGEVVNAVQTGSAKCARRF